MTVEEKAELVTLWETSSFRLKADLGKFLEKVQTEDVKPVSVDSTRTGAQNRALHSWFKQVSDICINQGVTFSMILKHTIDVEVTPEGVKGLWKHKQKALFDTDSTTKLEKTQQIEKILDHFIVLFAKEEVELPPFPSEESVKISVTNSNHDTAGNTDVPYNHEYLVPKL